MTQTNWTSSDMIEDFTQDCAGRSMILVETAIGTVNDLSAGFSNEHLNHFKMT